MRTKLGHVRANVADLRRAVEEASGRGARFNLTVYDPDSLWDRVKDAVTVVEPLFATPNGTRKFTIADPDGNELGFVRDG